MFPVSEKFNEAFASYSRQIFTRIEIGDKKFTNVNLTSVNLTLGSIAGESYAIGSTFANSAKIVFCEIIEGLNVEDEVKIDIGITYTRDCKREIVDGVPICRCESSEFLDVLCECAYGKVCTTDDHGCRVIEWCPMGIFLISEAVDVDRNENRTTVECMDRMILLERVYQSKLNYPASIGDVALEIANLAGIRVNESNFARLSNDLIYEIEGQTFRQALGILAQFEAGFVTFNREGLLEIRGLNSIYFEITPKNYQQSGLTKNELQYKVGGVQAISRGEVDESRLQAGASSGAQIILENPVMTQYLLNRIFEKVGNINYYPFSVNWWGNPALECGDWVSLYDRQGVRFRAPMLDYHLTFTGGLTTTSSAGTKSQSITSYQTRGTLNQIIERVNGIVRDNGNTVFHGLDEPRHPREGDIWFRPVGDETEMMRFENGEWVLAISSEPDERLLELIKEAEELGEQAKSDAAAAMARADQIFTDIDPLVNFVDPITGNMTTVKALVEGLRTEVFSADGRSQITQLATDINLRVMKGDVINQINISTEGILIDGVRTHITGRTTIENAVIFDAHIKDLNANKIRVGTLDAAYVNVINLNASSITSGTINANRIGARTITANHLTTNAIQVGFNDMGNVLRLYPQRLEFLSGDIRAGMITESGIQYWYGTRDIGRIAHNQIVDNPNVRGLSFALAYTGDYIALGYKNSSTATVNTASLVVDPRGAWSTRRGSTSKPGVHAVQRLYLNLLGTRNYTNVQHFEIGVKRINNVYYTFIGDEGGRNGIAFGSGGLYFLQNGTAYSFSGLL